MTFSLKDARTGEDMLIFFNVDIPMNVDMQGA